MVVKIGGLRKRYQRWVHEYMAEKGIEREAVNLEDVARWAFDTGRHAQQPVDPVRLLQRELSRALRDETYIDPQGREVRLMHAARTEQQSLWADIRYARPTHMRVSLQQRRDGILADVRRHKIDADSFNENNTHGTTLPPFEYDFTKDLAELELPIVYPDAPPEGHDEDDLPED